MWSELSRDPDIAWSTWIEWPLRWDVPSLSIPNIDKASSSIKLGPLSIPNPFDKTGKLKSAALYDAINKSGADLIVNPQYVVTVDNLLLFKTYNVNISGYKGTIKGFKGDNLVD